MGRRFSPATSVVAFLFLASAPASAQSVSVVVSPSSAILQPNQTEQFTANVTGSTDQAVTWLVNGVRGGAPSTGVITASGLYTAPASPANMLNLTVAAEPAAAPEQTGAATVGVAAATQLGLSYYVATTGNDSNPARRTSPGARFSTRSTRSRPADRSSSRPASITSW